MKRWTVWALAGAVVVAGGGATVYALAARSQPKPVTQPLAFNHQKHTTGAVSLACTECHPGAERQASAGLPSLDRCLGCHVKRQSDAGAEEAVRAAAVKGGPFAFQQVTRNAGHVYFSHGAHVTGRKLPCASCHGDVTAWTKPPEHPETRMTSMDACMDCHRKNGGSTSCGACHR